MARTAGERGIEGWTSVAIKRIYIHYGYICKRSIFDERGARKRIATGFGLSFLPVFCGTGSHYLDRCMAAWGTGVMVAGKPFNSGPASKSPTIERLQGRKS
jgi:hypothetical protein